MTTGIILIAATLIGFAIAACLLLKRRNTIDTADFDFQPPDGIGTLAAQFTSLDDKLDWFLICWLFLPLPGIFVLAVKLFKPGRWFFAGNEGFAICKVDRKRRTLTNPQIVRFRDVSGLSFSKIHHYTGRIYTHTIFVFWLTGDRTLYKASGRFRQNQKKRFIRFLDEVESQWNAFCFPKIAEEFETSGFARFGVRRDICIGMNYIKYKDVVLTKEQIRRFWLHDGKLWLEHKRLKPGYGIFGRITSRNRTGIDVNSMPNRDAFLYFFSMLKLTGHEMPPSLYRSPFTLMSWESDEIPARKDILSAEKRRLAELESSGEMSLRIQDRAYSKDEIIKAFDAILSDAFLPWHLHVKRDAALLRFLETGVYSPNKRFLSQEIYGDDGFRQWLSPFFAAAFASILKQSIETPHLMDVKHIADLLRENISFDRDHEAEAWEPLKKQLSKAVSYLELYAKDFSWKKQKDSILQLGSIYFLQLLTLKPAYLFYDETYEYTNWLHNTVAGSIHKHDDQYACTVYYNLLNLELDPQLREICLSNMKRNKDRAMAMVTDVNQTGFPRTWSIIYGDSHDINRMVNYRDWSFVTTLLIMSPIVALIGYAIVSSPRWVSGFVSGFVFIFFVLIGIISEIDSFRTAGDNKQANKQ
ncbi:MAG: hypothetical protein LBK97_02015 [Prevotellaceae bacterium]|jgi:hypothetical protein|nr:hypothetical protein [Prevotellaceae bacterium]